MDVEHISFGPQEGSGGTKENINKAQLRGKVEATLQSRLVFGFLAENADLYVKYVEDDFKQKTLDQLDK